MIPPSADRRPRRAPAELLRAVVAACRRNGCGSVWSGLTERWLPAGALGLMLATALPAQQPRAFPEESAGASPFETREAGVSRTSFSEPAVVTAQSPYPEPARPATTNNAAEFVDQPLADVRVEGNTTIPENAILHFVKSQAGRPVAPDQIREDVASLLARNWFFRVTPTFRVTESGPVLIFQVVEKPILRSVEFIGNKKIKTPVLTGLTGLVAGHGFDVAANKEAVVRIEQYYREKGYHFAKVTLAKGGHPDDRDVVFEIDEGKKVRVHQIWFKGNDEISTSVLKTKLATKTIIGIPGTAAVVGGSYDPETIRSDVQTLVRYYHALGYFDASVEPIEELNEDKSEVHVTFRVSEGPRFRVRSIEVIGNAVIPTSELLADPQLQSEDFYNERFLREDIQAMRDKYDDLGRLFAEVEPVPRFLEEAGWVDLVYHVNEDKPYRIGQINVHIAGDHPHSQELLVLNQVNRWVKPGDLARMRDIQGAQKAMRGSKYWDNATPASINVRPVDGADYLPPVLFARGQDDGLSDVQLTPRSNGIPPGFGHSTQTVNSDPDEVFSGHDSETSLGTEILAEPQARLQPSRRERFTSDLPVVNNRIATHAPPPAYNIDPDAIFRNESSDVVYRGQSINQYGQPVPYDPLQTNSPQGDPFGDALRNPATPGFVDVDIDVTEARTGRLMFGVGVNSDAGVVGSIVLQEDNFDICRPPTSWADIVNGTAWRGRGQSFRLELVPGTEVSRYMATWQNPYFLNTDFSLGLSGFYYNRYFDDWTEDRLGGRISVGRLLSRYWSAGIAMRLENVHLRDIRAGAPPILTDSKGDNFLSTLQYTLTYDTRDSAFLPTEGHMVELSYEQAFGEFDYPRVGIEGSQFFTVWQRPDGYGKHILQFRGQAAWTGEDTPIFERLYAGGYSSFRGFAFRGVSPIQAGTAVGGEFMVLGSAEYMIPITADDNIRAVVFSDFGTVDEDVTLDAFRVTAGFGFRLAIPAMGPAPIALDFAFPILSEPFDDERIFSFYVGFTR